MTKSVTLKPRLSEKSYALSEERNTYVFLVPPNTNRQEIAKAIATQFSVKVEAIRTASQPGKNKRVYRRKGRSVIKSQSSPSRKAYVRLKEEDKLPIFDAVKEDTKPKQGGK